MLEIYSYISVMNDTLNGGFPDGSVEASVDKPEDGLNGNETTTENVERVNRHEEKEIAIKEWDEMSMRDWIP